MWSIRSKVLRMVMEASKDSYPLEFGAFMRADGDLIYEIAILPGTIQGDRHTMFFMYMKPIDFSLVGTIHSHPSGVPVPSEADLSMFSNTGAIHIIVAHPYGIGDFAAYNRKGERIDIRVV
ncbi:MAG: Mov34/MPN/PAD-1 family protein [Thermoplasmataceae archaeon]